MALARGLKRKVSHHRRILSSNLVKINQTKPGDIIQFSYRNTSAYDKSPLVLILGTRQTFLLGKSKGKINGVNLNYLKEFLVQSLLKETNWNKLKRYSMYKDAIRTYDVSKMVSINAIEYKMDK